MTPVAQAAAHDPQCAGVFKAAQTPPQQPCPPAQQAVPHATCPVEQGALHAVAEALQPVEGHVVTAGAGHCPLASQTLAPVCTPAVQTWADPHEVPAALFVVSEQTGTPVAQEKTPFLHGFVGWQPAFGVQVPHVPLLQNIVEPVAGPQFVPSGMLVPRSVQIGAPLEQTIAPLWHRLLALHVIPATQETQAAVLLQTALLPHILPGGLLVALSTHTETPVAHDVTPTLQGLGLPPQPVNPGVQLPHTPALQKKFVVPHGLPSERADPVSVQVDMPVAHDSVPWWQELAGVQDPPAVQVAQLPVLHTIPVPHELPAVLFPLSTQTDDPLEQDVVPVLHAFAGWQATPATHVTQRPTLHTRPDPHDVPSARAVPVSVQTAPPVLQDWLPVWQGLAGWQTVLAEQVTHAPFEQTMFEPQVVPLEALPDSTQVETPVAHEVVPSLHALVV